MMSFFHSFVRLFFIYCLVLPFIFNGLTIFFVRNYFWQVVSKLGGTIEDMSLIDGLLFNQKATHAAGGPSRVEVC